MVTVPRLSKGLRRHIRNQKAMIRRQLGDTPEAVDKIKALLTTWHKPKLLPAEPVTETEESQGIISKTAKQKTTRKPRAKPASKKT